MCECVSVRVCECVSVSLSLIFMYCMAVRAGADAEGCYLGDGGLVLLHELIHLLLVLLLARLQVVLLLLETTQLLIQLRERGGRERESAREI